MSGKEKGWRYNPFSGLTFALSAAFRTCSLALSLPLPLVLYTRICVCILFLMFCFLTLAVICSACVCVCVVSAVWERVRVVVCRLCLALFITQPNDEFIFLCFVFFHMLVTLNLLSCALITECLILPACLNVGVGVGVSLPWLACCHYPCYLCFFPPFWQASKKAKWCVMASRDMCHICYSYAVVSVLVAFLFFSTCNVLQAKKKWVLAAVQNCDTKGIRLAIEILHIFYILFWHSQLINSTYLLICKFKHSERGNIEL